MTAPLPPAALLDRDGTINVKAREGEYVTRPDEMKLLPGAAEAISRLNAAGVPVAVVTNQRGIALGRMTEEDLREVHGRMSELLGAAGAWVDGVFHCPHEVRTCACRKPGTLLLEQAKEHFGLSTLEGSMMIGDSLSDVLAGRAVGAWTVLLSDGGVQAQEADELAGSLLAAVTRTLERVSA